MMTRRLMRRNELFLKMMRYPKLSRAFCSHYLPKEVMHCLQYPATWTIRHLNTKVINPPLKSTRDGDVLLLISTDTVLGDFLFAIEAQHHPEPLMGVRLAFYTAAYLLNENGSREGRPIPLITVIYHYGSGSLTPLNRGFVGLPKVLQQHMTAFGDNQKMKLIDLCHLSDKELMSHGLFASVDLLLKYADRLTEALLDQIMPLLMAYTDEMRGDCLEFFANRGNFDRITMLRIVENYLPKEEVMTLRDQFEEAGFERGRRQAQEEVMTLRDQFEEAGFERGRRQARKEVMTLRDQFEEAGFERGRRQAQEEVMTLRDQFEEAGFERGRRQAQEEVMTLRDQFEETGFRRGHTEGKKEAMKLVAANMLRGGADRKQVMHYTGLSLDEIQGLVEVT